MISILLFGVIATTQEAPDAAYYQDTSELLGIVALWPRENILLFENQLVRIESDAFSYIVSWNETHVYIRDVFGELNTIDIRKVPRSEGSLWSGQPNVTLAQDALILGAQASPEGGQTEEPDTYNLLTGIGHHTSRQRFYSTSYVESADMTKVRQSISQIPDASASTRADQQAPIDVRLQGWCTPVSIRDQHNYIYITSENARFGHLVIQRNGSTLRPIENAGWFLPLRLIKVDKDDPFRLREVPD